MTGRSPFQGEHELETLLLVQSSDPVPPRRLRPNTPRYLEVICLKCLRKELRRYAGAGAGRRLAAFPGRHADPGPAAEHRRTAGQLVPAAAGAGSGQRSGRAGAGGRRGACRARRLTAAPERLEITVSSGKRWLPWNGSRKSRRSHSGAWRSRAVPRGLDLCEDGQGGPGLLWLAQALQLTRGLPPADVAHLQPAIRANLAAWARETRPVQAVFSHPSAINTAFFGAGAGTVVIVGQDGTNRLWDADASARAAGVVGHQGTFDHRLQPRRQDRAEGKHQRHPTPVGAGHGQTARRPLVQTSPVLLAALSPDGQTVARSAARAA